MRMVAQASNAEQAFAEFRRHRPDITLMDLRLPGTNGTDTLIAIRGEFPDARIIMLRVLAQSCRRKMVIRGLAQTPGSCDSTGCALFPGARSMDSGCPCPRFMRFWPQSDGSLWIGTRASLSRWKNQALTHYPIGPGGVASIVEDSQGTIWFGLAIPATGSGPLCQVVEAGTRCFGIADGVPSFRGAGALLEDWGGNLWIGGSTTLLRWTSGSPTVYLPSGLKTNSGIGGITGLASTPDGTLPGLSGLELQRQLAGRTDMPIICITGYGDVPTTVQAMKAGAFDFLTKPLENDVLLAAIRHAFERSHAALLYESEMQALRICYASLTPRERGVMALVVPGLLNKQVGGELGISEITVNAHRQVMRKMKADALPDLVTMAARLGVRPSATKH